jgi:myo-inositol-1(or 4)-monophosphatase
MKQHLTVAVRAARAAGEIIMQPGIDIRVEEKEREGLVTELDFASQARIIQIIHQVFPDHAILGEEGDDQAAVDAPHLWVIDPLDGTNNFVHSIPQYSVSIAYAEAGNILAGVVLDPVRDELFSAAQGQGAFLNGKPIRVSERASLTEVMVATGFYYDRDETMERTLDAIRALFRQQIHGIRRFGSAALDLCWIACGRFDAFFEYQLSPWDFAAGALIVREAGGLLEDRKGRPIDLTSSSMVTANPLLFESFAEVVRWQK